MSYNDFNYKPFTSAYDIGGGYTSATGKMTAPTNVNIQPGYMSVSADWSKVNGADLYLVTITSNSVSIHQHTSVNNIRIDSGLDHGTKYKMSIEAIDGGIKGPTASEYFETLETLAAPPSPPTSPPTSPVDICTNCTDNDSCTSCAGKPFCVDGECQICDPNGVITTDSDCYQYRYICVGEDGGECEKCNTLAETKATHICQLGYGDDYSCNMETGKCEMVEVSPSPPKISTNWGLIIGLIIGILVTIILCGLLIFILTRKEIKSGVEWPEPL